MKIGLIAPPWVPVPPSGYGGTEVVVANLAKGLTELGHDVRLFTIGESTCPQTCGYVFDEAVTPIGEPVSQAIQAAAAYEELSGGEGVDIIHDHTWIGPLLAQQAGSTIPVVTTMHQLFDPLWRRYYTLVGRTASIIAISHDQAGRAGRVPITAVIHHGIDLDQYRPGPGGGGYLVFVGRMSPDKGVANAIQIARAAGRPLHVVAKMRQPEELEYYRSLVRPMLGADVTVVEEMPLAERVELVGNAYALLDPIEWHEPFGLVMAEALAVGTPVVAYPMGAAPEIVDDGVTGFLRRGLDRSALAVADVAGLSREACREAAEARFSLQRMAKDHERLFTAVLESRGRLPRPRRGLPEELVSPLDPIRPGRHRRTNGHP